MKKQLCIALALTVIVVASIMAITPNTPLDAAEDGDVLRHVVLFKFNEDLGPKKVQEVVDAFRGLPAKIDTIRDFEWGTDVSVEQKAAGFTHCFIVSFDTTAGRDEYLPHPAHKEFVALVGPRLADVLVVDFWVKK